MVVKLKISALPDEKPVKMTIELPASVHRDLLAYSDIIATQAGQEAINPSNLVAAMVKGFMETDRAFAKAKKARVPAKR